MKTLGVEPPKAPGGGAGGGDAGSIKALQDENAALKAELEQLKKSGGGGGGGGGASNGGSNGAGGDKSQLDAARRLIELLESELLLAHAGTPPSTDSNGNAPRGTTLDNVLGPLTGGSGGGSKKEKNAELSKELQSW